MEPNLNGVRPKTAPCSTTIWAGPPNRKLTAGWLEKIWTFGSGWNPIDPAGCLAPGCAAGAGLAGGPAGGAAGGRVRRRRGGAGEGEHEDQGRGYESVHLISPFENIRVRRAERRRATRAPGRRGPGTATMRSLSNLRKRSQRWLLRNCSRLG